MQTRRAFILNERIKLIITSSYMHMKQIYIYIYIYYRNKNVIKNKDLATSDYQTTQAH